MDWKSVKAMLEEFNASPLQVLAQVDELQKRSYEGIATQKVSAKDGVLDLVETHPAIELQCIKFKWAVVEFLQEREDLEGPGQSEGLHVTVSVVRPTDV